ncbi:MAG: metallophosphoesterase family protein [Bacteroidales bacterium]|jgi:predicted phosphodiesterase|nr:metallophosphoesterase family protein [Bacteroidales bacterium]
MDRKLFFRILLLASILCVGSSVFAQTPYNIVMNIYDDPKTKMAFNWFTTSNTTGEQVQISLGTGAFTPFKTVNANSNQNVHKAVVTGLSPNTTYSFRVGKANLWSSIGTFTTAKNNKDYFSFIYITDTQSQNDDYTILQTHCVAAFTNFPNAKFLLHCGDLVDNGSSQSQWDQFFTKQQHYFYRYPFAPIQGNHDLSGSTLNFSRHFNLSSPSTSFDSHGSTYTYVYGDAQFFAINSEQWSGSTTLDAAYITALKNWMRAEVAAHQDIKWRIVYYHKSIYTGASDEQNEQRCAVWHNTMAPFFDELNIHLALQGHSHIYDVIGPIYNINTVSGAVSGVTQGNVVFPQNASGKSGGTFNEQNGTLYLTNGTFGNKHFFSPLSLIVMPGGAFPFIPHYKTLMTGRYGQTGKSTYSNISVSTSSIVISTAVCCHVTF